MKKILIFLFVNGKCYGNQLARMLHTPLTPIQKALARLEKGGIIASYYEGKTRLYHFNPACPMLHELELLLKKAYTLLSPQEKKLYAYVKQEIIKGHRNSKVPIHLTIWDKLGSIKELTFHAKTNRKEESGWHGKGIGDVVVTSDGDNILIFDERGTWRGENNQETEFSNIFRWTLDRISGMISLEHLRHGWNNPVFLFHLAPAGAHSMTALDPHLCDEDAYFGQLYDANHCLRLHWRVIGNKKNEELDYYYK